MNIEIDAILQDILKTIQADGWSANGWNLTPPYCLRAAATQAIWTSYPSGEARQMAYAKTLAALAEAIYGKPRLGCVTYWEQDQNRTQADIEKLLIETIETLKRVAA